MYFYTTPTMLIYVFVILVANSFGAQIVEKKLVPNQENDDTTLNVKMTKSFDIHLDAHNLNNWGHHLNDIVKTQIQDNIEEKSNGASRSPVVQDTLDSDYENETENVNLVRAVRASEYCQKTIIDHLASISSKLQNTSKSCEKCNCKLVSEIENTGLNYGELCKQMVGVSKPIPCQLIADNIKTTKSVVPKSCKEIQEKGKNVTGLYEIQPKGSAKPFWVLCDMETRGGGWTVIQKRFDGSEDFYREWRDYKFGFGDLNREFWIGLENIYVMTGFEVNELLIELTDREKNKAYASYKGFGIGPEKDGYPLNNLIGFSGDAGDSLTDHLNQKFSTKDMDQDTNPGNCAQMFLGGWWYKSCHISNLNGKYINLPLPADYKFKGLHWLAYRGHEYCHAGSRMLVRPVL